MMEKEQNLKEYPWLKSVSKAAKRNGWDFRIDLDDDPVYAEFSIILPSGHEVISDLDFEDVPKEHLLPEFLKKTKESFEETTVRLKDIIVAMDGPGSEEICQPEADGIFGEYVERKKKTAEADSVWFAEKSGKLYEKLSGLLRESAVMSRGIRELSGMAREEFAEAYGISTNTIRNWEAGRRPCPAYISSLLERAVRDDLARKEALEYSYSEKTLRELGFCLHGILEATGKLLPDSCANACEYPAMHFLDAFKGAIGIEMPAGLAMRIHFLTNGKRLKQLIDTAETPLEESKWKFFRQGFQEYDKGSPAAENVQTGSTEEGCFAETVEQND